MLCARLIAVLLAFCATLAQAQAWPSKPVRIVVAFAAGGSTDVAVRSIQEYLPERGVWRPASQAKG